MGAHEPHPASERTDESSSTSAFFARGEFSPPVMAIIGAPSRLKWGSSDTTSAVAPLLLMKSAASSRVTMPRSPCAPSAA